MTTGRWSTIVLYCVALSHMARAGSVLDGMQVPFRSVSQVDHKLHDLVSEELVHTPTGARLMCLLPHYDTPEKTFAVSFRTIPRDSKGIPHVLEHAVLSGSQKYPSRFPLDHFSKTSMSTFVNAFTHPDRTTYPVSTLNTKDLYNLVSVYLDGVFDPLVLEDKFGFEREGWHLELEDMNSNLTYSGVVFNEMKGRLSDPLAPLHHAFKQYLLNGTVYENEAGGIPHEIVHMSYEDLLNFYYDHYHPSNADIVYFGQPDGMEDLLKLVDQYLMFATDRASRRMSEQGGITKDLQDYRRATKYDIRPQASDYVKYIDVEGPPDGKTPKDVVSTIFYLGDRNDISECESMSLNLLGRLLLGKREAPLYKHLQDSHIGTTVVDDGFGDYKRAMLFEAGFMGVPKCDQPTPSPEETPDKDPCDTKRKVEKLIFDGLRQIVDNGLEDDAVKATFNRQEFAIRKHIADAPYKGMAYAAKVLDKWTNDADPLLSFPIDETLQCVKTNLAENPRYFESLIEKYLLENKDRVTIMLHSDPEYEGRRRVQELDELQALKSTFTEDELLDIVNETVRMKALNEIADTPETLAKLPKLPLDVISRESVDLPIEVTHYSEIPITLHELPTAGIAYIKLYIDLRDLSLDDLQLASLVHHLLIHGDTESMTATERQVIMEKETGGIRAELELSHESQVDLINDPSTVAAFYQYSTQCLVENVEKCVETFAQTLLSVADLSRDQAKAEHWLKELIDAQEAGPMNSPSRTAIGVLSSYLSIRGLLAEKLGGMASLEPTRKLLERVKGDWNALCSEMQDLMARTLNPRRMAVSITGDEESLAGALYAVQSKALEKVLGSNESAGDDNMDAQFSFDQDGWHYQHARFASDLEPWSRPTSPVNIFLDIPAMVYNNYLGGQLHAPLTEVQFKERIPARILSVDYIFPKVRFLGGAYGGSFQLRQGDGVFITESHSDPNLEDTYKTMLGSGEAAMEIAEKVTQDQIDQYIIRAISHLDALKSNSGKGVSAFVRWMHRTGIDHFNKVRADLLSVTKEDFKRFARVVQQSLDESPLIAVSIGPSKGQDVVEVAGLKQPFAVKRLLSSKARSSPMARDGIAQHRKGVLSHRDSAWDV